MLIWIWIIGFIGRKRLLKDLRQINFWGLIWWIQGIKRYLISSILRGFYFNQTIWKVKISNIFPTFLQLLFFFDTIYIFKIEILFLRRINFFLSFKSKFFIIIHYNNYYLIMRIFRIFVYSLFISECITHFLFISE